MKNFFSKIIDIFKPFFKYIDVPFTGVLTDNRSDAEKQLDPLHEEVAAGIQPVTWSAKDPTTWKHYTLRSQYLWSSDCIGFSNATGVEADRGLNYPLSARDIYDRRSNYPGEGMIPAEGLSIVTKYGVLPDSVVPSNDLTEEQLDVHLVRTQADLDLAAKLSGGIPVTITNLDIDTIAAQIDQGKTVRLCFHFTESEWTAIPQLLNDGAIHHQVIGVDYSIVNGKKCIIIQDSCFLNTSYAFPHGLRAITEDFLLARCFFAGYIQPLVPVSPQNPPQHQFTVDLQYGDSGNEVVLLQQKLASLGIFHVAPTGYFGGLTKQAVILYQTMKNLPTTGFVGPMTRAQLNQ